MQEVLEHALPELRVLDLRMPLHPVQLAGVARERGHRGRVARRQHLETVRRFDDGVAVTHPRGLRVRLAAQELAAATHPAGGRQSHLGRAVLARAGRGDLAAELLRHDLEAVADAEGRDPELEHTTVELGRALLVDARRAATQHDARGVLGGDLGSRDRVRHDLAVDAGLAHAARDQLGVLGAEVDDEHGMRLGCDAGRACRGPGRIAGRACRGPGRDGHAVAPAGVGAGVPAASSCDRTKAGRRNSK